MVSQSAMKARRCSYVFLHIRQRLLCHLFLSVKSNEMSSKKRHILMHISWHQRLLHLFFFTEGDKTPSKNATSWWQCGHIFLRMASEFSTSQKTDYFVEILYHQRWWPNLLFHCRQKLLVILHYSKSLKLEKMRSNKNTKKMYQII